MEVKNKKYLTEVELRNIKGGYTITFNEKINYCPLCGYFVKSSFNGKEYEAYCPTCRSPLEIKKGD